MFLVQVLLPQCHDDRSEIPADRFAAIRRELTERFGGVTAYVRSPAKGLWKAPDGTVEDDTVVMVEVQVDSLDRAWWGAYRRTLERTLRQQTILIRAIAVDVL